MNRPGNTMSRAVAGVCVIATSLFSCLAPIAQAHADNIPPVILFDDILERSVVSGEPFRLSAEITDADGISRVWLFLRALDTDFSQLRMKLDPSSDATYFYDFKAGELQPPAVEYYIEALDLSNNAQSVGFQYDPLIITVKPAPVATSTISNQPPVASRGSGNTMWYVLGGIALAVVGAALIDDSETVTTQFPLVIK